MERTDQNKSKVAHIDGRIGSRSVSKRETINIIVIETNPHFLLSTSSTSDGWCFVGKVCSKITTPPWNSQHNHTWEQPLVRMYLVIARGPSGLMRAVPSSECNNRRSKLILSSLWVEAF